MKMGHWQSNNFQVEIDYLRRNTIYSAILSITNCIPADLKLNLRL